MAEKREPGRFTIGFNMADPAHQAVVELLNRQGRKKAQFIVNAIQHYIHCPETPDIPQSGLMDHYEIEKIVRKALLHEVSTKHTQSLKQENSHIEPSDILTEATSQVNINTEDMAEMIGTDAMSAIADTLAVFRD